MERIFEKAEKRIQTMIILAGTLGFVVGIGVGIGIALVSVIP